MSLTPDTITVSRAHEPTIVADRFEGVSDETILLISEAEAPSSRWPIRLVHLLVAEGFSVIRFDHRDVGRSSIVETEYSLDDLAVDALAVMDACSVKSAHVVGRSMGGMVAQLMAIHHRDRVRALTLVTTTAGAEDGEPPMEWLVNNMAERLFVDPPMTAEAKAEAIVEQRGWFAGTRCVFDPVKELSLARDEVAAAEFDPHHRPGHGFAVVEAASRVPLLRSISVPTSIVHGTADPVYPVSHAWTLHENIPRSRLELIEELGHEMPSGFADELVKIIIGAEKD